MSSNSLRKPWSEDNISDEIERIKEKIKYIEAWGPKTANEIQRLQKIDLNHKLVKPLLKPLSEMQHRHKSLKIRLRKLEWDSRNIVEVIERNCKYDDCDNNKINVIQYPKDFPHYAKEECSKCGRLQTYVPFPKD